MAYNKVVYGNTTLVDLTGDTVTANTLFDGAKAHNNKGIVITGTLFHGFPSSVTITKIASEPSAVSKKEKNIVIYNNKTLINLSSDTVTESTLLWGYRCHKKDGTVINGTFLKNYPDKITFQDNVLDSSGNNVLDKNSSVINGTIVYQKSVSGNNIIYTKI